MSQSVREVNQCVSDIVEDDGFMIELSQGGTGEESQGEESIMSLSEVRQSATELSQSEFGEGQSEVSQYDSVEEGQSVDEESQDAVSDASDMASCLRAEEATT